MFLLLFPSKNYGQFSAYHGIVFPYDNPNNIYISAGSFTCTLPDYSGNIKSNPVCLSQIKYPQVTINFNLNNLKYKIYDFMPSEKENSRSLQSKYNVNLDFFSSSIPIKIKNKLFSIGIIINKIDCPEHEIWMTSNESRFNFQHYREGYMWNASIGIGHKFPFNMNIGISWTKWFGSWNWRDKNMTMDILGKGKFKYDGNNVNLGISKSLNNILLSFVYHSPIVLMKAKNSSIKWQDLEEKYNHQQIFNGAFKIGVVYFLNNQFSISSGYRFQNKFSIIKRIENGFLNIENKDEYNSSHQIVLAGEYCINLKKRKVPLFLAYLVNWLPQTISNTYGRISGYQLFSIDEYSDPNSAISFGINYPFGSFKFNFISQWDLNSIEVFTNLRPFYASVGRPLRTFEANKSTLLFNFGISYVFKKGN